MTMKASHDKPVARGLVIEWFIGFFLWEKLGFGSPFLFVRGKKKKSKRQVLLPTFYSILV